MEETIYNLEQILKSNPKFSIQYEFNRLSVFKNNHWWNEYKNKSFIELVNDFINDFESKDN